MILEDGIRSPANGHKRAGILAIPGIWKRGKQANIDTLTAEEILVELRSKRVAGSAVKIAELIRRAEALTQGKS